MSIIPLQNYRYRKFHKILIFEYRDVRRFPDTKIRKFDYLHLTHLYKIIPFVKAGFFNIFTILISYLSEDFMILLRLSGHSGAGKTRLVNALPQYGITCPKVLRYTSRPARKNEVHGEDYYFLSRSFIESLPEKDFLVGPVRNMVQAFDLRQLEIDLSNHELVLI